MFFGGGSRWDSLVRIGDFFREFVRELEDEIDIKRVSLEVMGLCFLCWFVEKCFCFWG